MDQLYGNWFRHTADRLMSRYGLNLTLGLYRRLCCFCDEDSADFRGEFVRACHQFRAAYRVYQPNRRGVLLPLILLFDQRHRLIVTAFPPKGGHDDSGVWRHAGGLS